MMGVCTTTLSFISLKNLVESAGALGVLSTRTQKPPVEKREFNPKKSFSINAPNPPSLMKHHPSSFPSNYHCDKHSLKETKKGKTIAG